MVDDGIKHKHKLLLCTSSSCLSCHSTDTFTNNSPGGGGGGGGGGSTYILVVIKIGKRHLTACQKEKEATHVRKTVLVGMGVTFFFQCKEGSTIDLVYINHIMEVSNKHESLRLFYIRGCHY